MRVGLICASFLVVCLLACGSALAQDQPKSTYQAEMPVFFIGTGKAHHNILFTWSTSCIKCAHVYKEVIKPLGTYTREGKLGVYVVQTLSGSTPDMLDIVATECIPKKDYASFVMEFLNRVAELPVVKRSSWPRKDVTTIILEVAKHFTDKRAVTRCTGQKQKTYKMFMMKNIRKNFLQSIDTEDVEQPIFRFDDNDASPEVEWLKRHLMQD